MAQTGAPRLMLQLRGGAGGTGPPILYRANIAHTTTVGHFLLTIPLRHWRKCPKGNYLGGLPLLPHAPRICRTETADYASYIRQVNGVNWRDIL